MSILSWQKEATHFWEGNEAGKKKSINLNCIKHFGDLFFKRKASKSHRMRKWSSLLCNFGHLYGPFSGKIALMTERVENSWVFFWDQFLLFGNWNILWIWIGAYCAETVDNFSNLLLIIYDTKVWVMSSISCSFMIF